MICGLDPGLLEFETNASTASVGVKLSSLERLFQLEKSLGRAIAFPPGNTLTALIAAGSFPYRQHFIAILRAFDPDGIYSANDLIRLLQQLLERSAVESELSAHDILHRDAHVTPVCDGCSQLSGPVEEERLRLLALLAIHNTIAAPTAAVFSGSHSELNISTVVEALEPDSAAQRLGSLPQLVEQTVPDLAGTLISNIWSAHDAWLRSTCDRHLEEAILLRCIEVLGSENTRPSFAVGSGFFDSLVGAQAMPTGPYGGVLLNKAALILVKPETQDINPFTDSQGSRIFRGRDNAAAMRAHLTKEHLALRLMYWVLPNGKVEFANVGQKHQLVIANR